MDERKELIELLLEEASNVNEFFEEETVLSFSQQRLWFLNQLSEGKDISYNEPFALRLRGTLNIAATSEAINAIIARHDILRARFENRNGKPIQLIRPDLSIEISVLEPAPHQIAEEVSVHARHVFDLSKDPLIKVTILKIDEKDYILLLNLHHIVADGWSLGILLQEFSELYRGALSGQGAALPALAVQYPDFAEWQRNTIKSETMEAQLAYWVRQLESAPNLIALPTDRPRPERMTGCGGQARFIIPNYLYESLKELSAREGMTLFMTLMATFMVLLYRATGQDKFLIGTPIAGRRQPELENIIGCFVNTLVLRAEINGQETLESHFRRVKSISLEAYENQDLPFEVLVQHLHPERSLSYTPVFQVMMALQNIPVGSLSLPNLTIEPFAQNLATAKFDLNLNMSERDTGISAILEYNSDIFEASSIDKFVRSFSTLLHDVVKGPNSRRIDELELTDFDKTVSAARLISEDKREDTGWINEPSDTVSIFWEEVLEGRLPIVHIPNKIPSLALDTESQRTQVRLVISWGRISHFRELENTHGISMQHCLLAAFVALQFRLSNQSDFIFGLLDCGQRVLTFKETKLVATHWSALRLHLSNKLSFFECIERVRQAEGETQKFSLSIEKINLLRDEISKNRTPIFPVSFSYECLHPDVDHVENISSLHLEMALTQEGYEVLFHFDKANLALPNVESLVQIYDQLIDALLRDPGCPISQAQLLQDNEREQILHNLNPISFGAVLENSLAQPFEECARRMPDTIALVEGKRQFSYQELDVSSNQLAHYLCSSGLCKGGRVAVIMNRSAQMVIGLYAVAKAGAAYVPIDPGMSHERIDLMLKGTCVDFVLVESDCKKAVSQGSWKIIDVDKLRKEIRAQSTSPIPLDQPSSGIAYCMYTSGSTGVPKAVQFPINSAIMSMRWLQRQYPVNVGDRHIFKTPFTFDVSIWEIFWPLYYGGTLVICDQDRHNDPASLRDLIEDHQIVSINFVPSILHVFLRKLTNGQCSSLRWVFSGGETLTPVVRDLCYEKLPLTTLLNLYGPTETHSVTDTVVEYLPGSQFIPLGRPSAAFRLYVLDENLEPMPIGVPGELYIGGDIGLAHGYCGQPALTADRFLPDPYGSAGARMYRSGDICRYFENGIIEYLGRGDRQVKIRGVRIEPAEIDTVLTAHEQVSTSVTIVIGEGIDRQLLSFVVPEDGIELDSVVIFSHASSSLPQHMIPTTILSISEVPTTRNGKIDVAALTEIWHSSQSYNEGNVEDTVPQDKIEEQMKQIFQQILNRAEIDPTKSFFELGGHSLLAFQLILACQKEFEITMPMHAIYIASSVRELASLVQQRNEELMGYGNF
ncbi:MAG: amino acid adenylation domain-containing protein [Symploca sp. SIO1B1]|nr:amino acid adenylation domain-containing protein [Symploca sp. SIO1B1]